MILKGNVGMLVHGYYLKDVRVRREAEALVEAGYKLEIFCLREPKQQGTQREPYNYKVNNVHIHRLPITRKRGKKFRYLYEYMGLIILGTWKLTLLHFKNRFQVIHIHNMPDLLVLAGIIPRLMGAKLLLDIHDPMPELYISKHHVDQNCLIVKALKLQEKFSCLLADHVISVNESMRERLESNGIPSKKISILHNFPDTRYLPIKKDITHWPRHRDGLTLLYAGTVTEHYRLDIIINSLVLVSKRIPQIKFRIIGDGNDLNRIIKLANNLGIIDYIKHESPVNIDDLRYIMEETDVGISCHTGDVYGDLQFSCKILDYLTQGMPVISSRTKTLKRYIPEEAIFYFEPDNTEDLAKQIIQIWNRSDLVKRKMSNVKKIFPQYTWQKEKYKLINLYQELLK